MSINNQFIELDTAKGTMIPLLSTTFSFRGLGVARTRKLEEGCMGFIAPPRGIGSGLLWSWYLVSVREVLFSSAAMCRRIPPLRMVSVRDEARQQLGGMNEMKCNNV